MAAAIARQSDIATCYSLSRVEEQLRGSEAQSKILILDVTPSLFRFARPPEGGEEPFERAPGIFLAVSRFPWDVNVDQPSGGAGFARALAGALQKPGLPLEKVFEAVRDNVGQQRNGIQWADGGATGNFYFVPSAPRRLRVGGNVMKANLISQTPPQYPPVARASGVQGAVTFSAVIGVDGHVKQLDLLSGDPLLVDAAREAVSQWLYKPTVSNFEPVEIATTITINFALHSKQ